MGVLTGNLLVFDLNPETRLNEPIGRFDFYLVLFLHFSNRPCLNYWQRWVGGRTEGLTDGQIETTYKFFKHK